MKPLKILYYSSHPNLNLSDLAGYGTHMREMIGAFRENGHIVQPLIMGGTEKKEFQVIEENKFKKIAKNLIKKIIPSIIWASLKEYRILRFDKYAFQILNETIDSFQPDLIYERATFMQNSGVRAANAKGVSHILEMNSPYVEEQVTFSGYSVFQKKATEIEKEQLLNSGKICVVSTALQAYFHEKHDIPLDKFLFTPNAIHPSLISVDEAEVAKIQQKYKLDGKIVLGFVGSIFPWHGVDLIIKALNKLKDTFPNLVLMVVGDGEIRPELEQFAQDVNLHERVMFTGSVPHKLVFNYIENMDVTIMAKSNWYGSPVKIFEYGAMKKAIIAPDNIPVRDVMTPDEDGLLVEAEVDDLVYAIQRLVENKDFREKLADNFYHKVMAKYVWTNIASQIMESLADIPQNKSITNA